jgi:DNA replication and repair protein RecF
VKELPRLVLQRLVVRDVRNLEHVDVELAPRLNVIAGSNGAGKTSLLESTYFVATSRSFRTHKTADIVRHGASAASVRAIFAEIPEGEDEAERVLPREQVAAWKDRTAHLRIDGNRPDSLTAYATRSPVVVFHPDELTLSSGPSAKRRVLLDRLALFSDPSSTEHRSRYARAIKARQEILRRGSAHGEIEAFEELAARHGAALCRARRAATDLFEPELVAAFGAIAAPGLELRARYAARGSDDEAEARDALRAARARDAHRPSASVGPHRDDLELEIDGHPARTVASQGQHRALTLAMKVAEATTIAAARGVVPLLLLDDVSSELDPDRTAALFVFLGLTRGQIILTTTRPELITSATIPAPDRRDYRVDGGVLTPLSSTR